MLVKGLSFCSFLSYHQATNPSQGTIPHTGIGTCNNPPEDIGIFPKKLQKSLSESVLPTSSRSTSKAKNDIESSSIQIALICHSVRQALESNKPAAAQSLLFFNIEKMSGVAFHPLIQWYIANERCDEGILLIKEMVFYNCFPHVSSIELLINALETEHSKALISFIRFIFESPFPLKQKTFHAFIFALAKTAEQKLLFSLLQKMQEHDFFPPANVYNHSIVVLAKMGDLKFAEEIFTKAQEENCACDLWVYTALIEGCIKYSTVSKAEKYFRLLKTTGLKLDAWVYRVLMLAYESEGQWSSFFALHQEAQKNGLTEITAYALKICKRAGKLELGCACFKASHYYQKLITSLKNNTLDCHLLTHATACFAVTIASSKKTSPWKLITGIGNHSQRNILFEMRKAIVNFINEHDLPIEYTPFSRNPGAGMVSKKKHRTGLKKGGNLYTGAV